MKERISNIREKFTGEKSEKRLRIIGLCLVAVFVLLFVFRQHGYVKFEQDGSVRIKTVFNALVVVGIAIATALVLIIKNNLSDRVNKICSYVLFGLSPIMCYFIVEEFHHNKYDIIISEISPFYLLLNIVILFVVLLALLVITNRTKLAVIGLCMITSGFGVINYYVYSFRGIAIVASDIYSAETAASVAGDYKIFLDYNLCFVAITTFFVIVLISRLRSFPVFPTWKIRGFAAAAYLALFVGFTQVFVFSNQLSNWNIEVKLYRPHKAYRTYGSILATVRTIGYILVEKPESYDVQKVEELASEYTADLPEGQSPNIIVVMNEAFSDLKSIRDFATSEDYMPFIRSLEENTIKGKVYVSSFGGNTANTEFEFLTGNSMAFLPANSVPYQLFIKDEFPSIVYQLEAEGYAGNIAMHPYHPNGYNRKKVYPLLGFYDFITLEDFSKDRLLRTRIPDEVDFERIIEEYENAKAQSENPFFIFNVTMQNHSGYGLSDPDFEMKITMEDEYYNEYTQTYLSLVKYTDEAVEKLVDYYKQVEEPTVIIFFGDHQPGLKQSWYDQMFGKSEEELTTEELMIKYQVPFFAWANYDIEEETVDGISMNYLSAYVFDKLGISLTKYQQYLLEVQESVPIMNALGYYGEDGNFYEYDDIESPYYEILSEYRNVQYNNIHDKGNRVDDMFYLEKELSGNR